MASPTAGYKLFTPYKLGEGLELQNRVVMAPLTRARATPTGEVSEIHEVYYEQRASAGLIITEATSISPTAHGWYCAPQMHTEQHMEAWKRVVDRVHAKGGKIFLQLWHIGRQGLAKLSPTNEVVSASAIGLPGGSLRDPDGVTHHLYSVPRALTTDEVAGVIEDYRKSAELAKRAGFDGVEVHSANGYLVDQFLQSCSNKRTDKYGGSIKNRARFLLELLDALKLVYPADRIAFRLAPNGAFGGMGGADNYDQFLYVMEQLSQHRIAYVSILDGAGFGYHDKGRLVSAFDAKTAYKGTILVNGDYTRDLGEGTLRSGAADLISYGRPYIANPDLVERFQNDWPLNPPAPYESWWDPSWGAKGLITWPAYEAPVTN
jgi:N-ethylmaleimide reductase